jgi:chromosome segregation ATPase
MGMTYAEATALVEKARVVVAERSAVRDEAKDRFNEARDALDQARQAQASCKEAIQELQTKLKLTRDAIMPNEAACKRALLELQATQEALSVAQKQRMKAEDSLRQLEVERDQAEELLGGAEQNFERMGVHEVSSRATLDERVQAATDAQRALDAALRMVDDAKVDVRREEEKLEKFRKVESSLPQNYGTLEREVQRAQDAMKKAVIASESAAQILEETREAQAAAESQAKELKAAYENAQANLRTAISAADRAETKLQKTALSAHDDEDKMNEIVHLRAEYAAAQDVRTAAMEVNARTLTQLADADVEAIRLRIACENASSSLDRANASRARAERELREAEEAVAHSQQERENTQRIVAAQEARLAEANANLKKLEEAAVAAADRNAAAQSDLRVMQEEAVRYGRESRAAADKLDGRRHELSNIVASIEVSREQLLLLRDREKKNASSVDAAYNVHQRATQALADAHEFIARAEREIEAKRAELSDAESVLSEVTAAFRMADETYSSAQRDYEVANADLTDAEVSLIMAEIDGRL